jgi:hypothetical protein
LERSSTVGTILLTVFATEIAVAKSFALVSGRRDPRIYAIDLEAALRPENNDTSNAAVSRSPVSPRRPDGALIADPANIVLTEDDATAYVMNHHGSVVNAEFLQHGRRANISIMSVKKMLEPSSITRARRLRRLSMQVGLGAFTSLLFRISSSRAVPKAGLAWTAPIASASSTREAEFWSDKSRWH